MPFWAFLDTSVLYPMRLADALLWIAGEDVYQPLWSTDVLVELRRNIRVKFPQANIDRRIQRMEEAFPEARIDGYRPLMPCMTNASEDRHVLAAAIVGHAQVIVTDNLADFPESSCMTYGIEAQSCDQFLSSCLHVSGERTVLALLRQAASKENPPLSFEELLELLSKLVPQFVDDVREFVADANDGSPELMAALRRRAASG